MTVNTGGKIRGLIARWVFRFEAAQGIINMVFRGITAVSTLTAALALIGAERYAKWLLLIGVIGTPIFAYAYTEFGIFNRKNRERSDRGANWSGPDGYMNCVMDSVGIFYGLHGRPPTEEEYEDIKESVGIPFSEFRTGIDPEEFEP